MLDQNRVGQVPVVGFVDFLSRWTQTPEFDGTLKSWALRMSMPGADLATLFTGETADPRRRGILTERQLLAARPSIVSRGVWMLGAVFCSQAAPPPPYGHDSFALPQTTTRRRALESATAQTLCINCHRYADELGFSLEHFDESGTFRDTDNGQDVDSSGSINLSVLSSYQDAPIVNFKSIDDLASDLPRIVRRRKLFRAVDVGFGTGVVRWVGAIVYRPRAPGARRVDRRVRELGIFDARVGFGHGGIAAVFAAMICRGSSRAISPESET